MLTYVANSSFTSNPFIIESEADCMIISCDLFYKIYNLAIVFKSKIHPVTVDRDLQTKLNSTSWGLDAGEMADSFC